MALVVIHSPRLNSDQKRRIGEALFEVLHQEGLPASQTVLLFKPETFEPTHEDDLTPEVSLESAPLPISPNFKTRARRTKTELLELKKRLIQALQANQTLTSLQARKILGLTNCDWAPSALRRFFGELEAQGMLIQQGLKRGTCYAWKGPSPERRK